MPAPKTPDKAPEAPQTPTEPQANTTDRDPTAEELEALRMKLADLEKQNQELKADREKQAQTDTEKAKTTESNTGEPRGFTVLENKKTGTITHVIGA